MLPRLNSCQMYDITCLSFIILFLFTSSEKVGQKKRLFNQNQHRQIWITAAACSYRTAACCCHKYTICKREYVSSAVGWWQRKRRRKMKEKEKIYTTLWWCQRVFFKEVQHPALCVIRSGELLGAGGRNRAAAAGGTHSTIHTDYTALHMYNSSD